MNQQSIGANPTGVIGKLAGKLMNLIHHKQYGDIILKIHETQKEKNIKIVDIGCGGGIAIRHFTRIFPEAQVYGIDISPDMVDIASELNRKNVAKGRVKIFTENVEDIALEDDTVELITVFDNINFWNDYGKAFSEMKRILKGNGRLFIINGYPEIGTKWYEFVKFKNVDEYGQLLAKNGFALSNHYRMGHTIILEGHLC